MMVKQAQTQDASVPHKAHVTLDNIIFIKDTKSLCPECLDILPATVFARDGQVFITKTCKIHGEYTELYWSDYELYKKAEEYGHLGVKLENPRTEEQKGCPHDCGICPNHKSSTVLGIIDVTNRCNLRCPICFAHAGAAGYLYEPTKEQIRDMMQNLLDNQPIWTPALQFSGGEPTVRDDLPELVRMALDMGFVHIEVDSNGIRMAESVEYCRTLKEAGVSTVYLQFDGVTPEPYLFARGFDLFEIKKRAISNLKKAGFRSIVLVPVLVKGVNDDQVGDIIRFAIDNKDCIRAVNFQPVSFTGRINKDEREKMRITIPDLIKLVEKQTEGLLKQEDWYPVPSVEPFCRFLSNVKDEAFVDFSAHPHCGVGTYLFIDEDDQVRPITDLMDVEALLDSLEKVNDRFDKGHGIIGRAEAFFSILRNVKFKALHNYLTSVILRGDYLSLNRMHHNMIMIGAMHFQDPYNFDIERVQRCIIHYSTPDGKLIPFCTMNTLHRRRIEKEYAQPLDEKKNTLLYDVEGLTKRIREEKEEELHQTIKIRDMPQARPLEEMKVRLSTPTNMPK